MEPSRHVQEHARGVVYGLSAYVLWGLLTIFWKALTGFDPLELIGYRIVASILVLAPVLIATRRWRLLLARLRSPRLVGRVGAAALLLSANWTAYVYAVVHGRVIETALGYFIAPLGTMAVGVFLLRERLTRSQHAAVVLGAIAVVVLTISYGRIPVIALVIAGSWTVYGYLKKQVPLQPVDGLAAETLLLLPLAIAAIAWGASRSGSIPATADAGHLALIATSGLVTTVPLVLFAAAAQKIPLTLLGPMQYAVPTINFLLGWLAYGEALPLSRIVGFAIVWLALAVFTIDMIHRSRSSPRIVPDPAIPVGAAGS